ncbi:MAG: TRAP transporter substrate-binding protein [Cyclobacteriaceae bacterium]
MKKVGRREFIKKAGTAAAINTALPLVATSCGGDRGQGQSTGAPAVNYNKTFEWKMLTTWPPNFPVLGEGCSMMADWVDKMSNGRLKIRVYGGGELVPALEAFEAVSSGVAEMGNAASYYWAGKAPASQFFASVPFGMNAQQLAAWIQSGGGLELWRELYAKFNLIPFLVGNTGVQMGGWFNKEINSLADVQGLKMRIPGLGGKVVTAAGGTAVLSAGGEIYTNLERGVIDATEWIGPYHDYKMGFHKIAKYYYYPGWHETGTAFETFVNKPKWEQLPSDLQGILEVALAWQNNWTLAEFDAQNAIHLNKLIKEEGVTLRQFPDEVLNAFRKYTKDVLSDITASDPMSRKVYDSYRSFQKKVKDWSGITEQIYYNKIQ